MYSWMIKQLKGYRAALIFIVVLNVILSLSSVASAVVSMKLIDHAMAYGFSESILYIILFAFILLAQVFLSAYLTIKVTKFKEPLSYMLQSRFLERLYKTEWSSMRQYQNGDIQTRLTNDVSNFVDIWSTTLPNMFSLFVQLVAAFATLLYYDTTLALFAFLLGPVTIVISWFIGRKLKRYQHHIQAAESQYRSYLTESVHHALIVKTFEHEKESMEQVTRLQQNKFYWVLKRQMYSVTAGVSMGIGYRIGFFLAFGIGAFKLSVGTTSFGTFTAFLQLVGQIQGPMEGLSRSLPLVASAIASAERLKEFEALSLEAQKAADHSPKALHQLKLEQIHFAYDEGNPILQGVNLNVNQGEIIAIVGTSGEGKTTLLRLLLTLLRPQAGELYLIDGDGQKHILSANTRSYFSYVPQGNTLLSGTIANNIRMGKPLATDEEIIAAAKQACAWEFIQKLPDGIQTRIGESGHGLSEGQAQRIAIARALLRPAPILLLDEATSALDLNTERQLIESLKHLSPHKTCIIITHRLSISEICDKIFELQRGQLVELKHVAVT